MLVKELINSDLNVTIAVKKSDLFDLFNEFTAQKTALETALKKSETNEVYYSPAEVAKTLQVDLSTLWRWEKQGYLTGVRVGGKKRYRQTDLNKILEGK
ncbi:MAG: helix-turn-helix domain-containing protein [Paludibacteraceae bacterium]|nr:helix-turn-helix domain-containing protein [Paludibacteraceae bacterium]